MNSTEILTGTLPFRRKVRFTFDLAALKRATAACRQDLGEFFTSEKVTDEQRFFFEAYGAYNPNEEHSPKKLMRFAKMYRKFNVAEIDKIKLARAAANIMSEEFKKALGRAATGQKKNY
jgi:hypothetical protein